MDIIAPKKTVNGLFTVTYQYRVPIFQRPYSWGAKQINDLWTDTFGEDVDGHFLGPIVLFKTERDDEDSTREVIDGQQRLVTLQILLAIIRDTWASIGQTRRGETANGLLKRPGYFEDEEDAYSLRSGDGNWDFLRDFILRAPDDEDRKQDTRAHMGTLGADELAANKALRGAWRDLRKRVAAYVEAGPEDPDQRLSKLEKKLSGKVELVAIEVSDLEDAFLLFETLNDRGLDLSAADLLKSHLLGRMSVDFGGDLHRIATASSKWDEMLRTIPDSPGVTPFLRHFLLLSHQKVQVKQIFPLFKANVRTSGAGSTLDELASMGSSYKRLVAPLNDDPAVDDLLNIKSVGVDTNRVPMLAAERWLDDADFIRFVQLLEVLTFRWIITGEGGQDMETGFRNLGESLHSSRGAALDEVTRSLIEQIPGDRPFREGFRARRMGDSVVASYVLRRIENVLVRDTELEIKPRTEVHIEHVMPKTATMFWRSRVRGDESYDEEVQRWGNLTLLKSELNESIKNAEFGFKKQNEREMDYTRSRIQMTLDLLPFDDWTSVEIDQRQQWMALVASRIWSVERVDGDEIAVPALADVMADPNAYGIETSPLPAEALESA